MRLQKYLAHCGVGSRRQAEKFIAAGLVKVNGHVITDMGVQIEPGSDRVEFNGEYLEQAKLGLLLLHKPKQVITTRVDTHDRDTVMDYLPSEYHSYFPVGRLDQDTTGLVIMTNDGELADHLTHPRYEIERTYVAEVLGEFRSELVPQVAAGIELEDGFVSAEIKILAATKTKSHLEVTLHIGRKHIVRRLLDHLGHPVLELSRIAHGPFKLGSIKPGLYQVLKDAEYRRLRAKILVDFNEAND